MERPPTLDEYDRARREQEARSMERCKHPDLVKVMVSPFNAAGWYYCEGCGARGPLWLLTQTAKG